MKEDGFSLIELLIVMVTTAMFTSLIMFFTFNFWRFGYVLEADLSTFTTRLNAGDVMRELISSSSGFINQNSIIDNNTHNPDTAYASNYYWITNHAVPGNKPVGASGTTTPLLYFKRFSTNSSNQLIMNGTQPYEDEYVLYLNGTTRELLLRNLANTSATGNKLATSCPKSVATFSCPADKIIADSIESIDIRYFSRSGNTVDWTSVYDPILAQYIGPDNQVVEVLEVTLNISKKAVFQATETTKNSTVIRIALRNT